MICIFSSPVDVSTIDVMQWLSYLGMKDVIRINYNDNHTSLLVNIEKNDFYFQLDGQLIYLKNIEAVWYRKGKNWLCDQFFPITGGEHTKFISHLNYRLQSEEAKLSEYLHHIIENSVPVVLGSNAKSDLNKLLTLHAAEESGLLVPDFFVSNNKEGLKNIFSRYPDLITKSLSEGLFLFEKEESQLGYFSYTEKVSTGILKLLPEKISPSFLQKNIHKKYELRVFFLENTCYSMVIFSQNDVQTQVDFRKYNEEAPNRCVPFLLPVEIDTKIKLLFKKLCLNTGSVDLLVDKKGNFYFLEINPVGQFGMVSEPCNYYLEKKIALYLMQNETRKSKA